MSIISVGNEQCQTRVLHNMTACRHYCVMPGDDRAKPGYRGEHEVLPRYTAHEQCQVYHRRGE